MGSQAKMVERLGLKLNFVFTLLSLLGGLGGFATFMPLGNYHAGIFALLSTIPTAGSLHMHFMNLRNQFEKFYTKDRLKLTGYFGIFLAPIGFIAALCYLIIALVNKIPFLPIEGSLLLAALQAFLTFKESATLAYFSRKHYKKIDQN